MTAVLRKQNRFFSLIIFAILLFNLSTLSQNKLSYFFPEDITFNSSITPPQSFFGFMPGDFHLRHDQLISYVKLLSQQSARFKLEEYGKTYEQRPLYLITISSPKNLMNIEKIKAEHRLLADAEKSKSLNVSEMPVVVWEGFSVHGNEASGANSVPLLLYYLAAAEGDKVEKMLTQMIILVDPCINPDGFDRFANWVNINRGKVINPDPNHREHQEYWPGGRGNHYWFDMNRDWLLLQQPETKARIVKYHEWLPNVLTDHHEQGTNATFFFQPGVPERANPLTPIENQQLTKKIGQYHAKELDKIGSLYFSREVYDDFYFGKGSTYPDINGAIGILFEQASSRGEAQRSDNGILAFPFTVRNQLTSALSTLAASYEMREELLNYQRKFFIDEIERAKKSEVTAYIFGSQKDPEMNSAFLQILLKHNIRVYELTQKIKADNFEFEPAASFIIPAKQQNYSLLKTIFEKNTSFKDSIFYDISAWSLPLAFNIPHAELKNKLLDNKLIGKEIKSLEMQQGFVEESKPTVAYAFPWNKLYAPKTLNKILAGGIKAKVATSPFKTLTANGETSFGYGTIIIPLALQEKDLESVKNILKQIADETKTYFYSISSGLSLEGSDLGSSGFRVLKSPAILMPVGSGVNSLDAGEIWQLLDQRFELNFSLVEISNLNRADLTNYTTVIMTGGNYNAIDSTFVRSLKEWIRKGGTLISTGTATEWLIKNKFTKAATVDRTPAKDDSSPAQKPYAQKNKDREALSIPGAIFKADIDITHPLGYGYEDGTLYNFVSGDIILQQSKDPYSTPVKYSGNSLVSGFISKRILNKFLNSAAVITEKFGSGVIIMMTEVPNYRAYWYGANKLMMNSIFFGQIIN
jgi:hypothetical protein